MQQGSIPDMAPIFLVLLTKAHARVQNSGSPPVSCSLAMQGRDFIPLD